MPTTLHGVVPGSVPATQPKAADLLSTPAVPEITALTLPFGFATSSSTQTFGLTNTASAPVNLSLTVLGVQGVTAQFPDSSQTQRLHAGERTQVTVKTDPMHAGSLAGGTVRIAVAGVAKPVLVPLSGAQAPLPPGAVTATPEADGAVHVTWIASPSTGVAGYEVERRVPGGQWEPLPGAAPAAGIVDQTGTDGQTLQYRVKAITAGVTPQLLSSPGTAGSALTDASPPAVPAGVKLPDFVTQANENAVPVEVDLPPTSKPTDVVSVTLTDGTDDSPPAIAAGGQSSVVVHVDATTLAEGPLSPIVTLTDAVGNATPATPFAEVAVKDTQAPDAPTDAQAPEVVNSNTESSVPVVVHVADPEPGERVHVEITGGAKAADGSADVSGAATTVNVDVSNLPDGPLAVSAWAIDDAGNVSKPTDGGTITKDTSAPESAVNIHVQAGDQNPAGYVNAASAGSVMAVVHFQQATDPADEIAISVGGIRVHRDGGDDTYFVGPLDLSDRPDGSVPLSVTVTDSAGNSNTTTDSAVKDTVAPSPPTSFTVPETADNAAGFVNSFTQNAAIFQATFPDGTDSTDTLAASVNGIDLGTRVGGSIAVQWKADVSGLPDGQLDLSGTITDAAGNSTDFSGRAVKETQAPPPPVAAHVIGFCQPDTITPSTAPNVSVQVVLPDMPGLSGTVTVTLTDSAGHTASGTAWGGPGIVVVHGIDASSFVPGHVHVSVSVTDAAGNTSTYDGTTATYIDPNQDG
ncbi:MAG TPA: Ig-like domain repeat protein [Gaiellales bacterium]|nr:Ig-like domain repeat protein [Gaiellales bacterium]